MKIKEAIESLTNQQLEVLMEFTTITEEMGDVNFTACMIVAELNQMLFQEYHVRAIADRMMLEMQTKTSRNDDVIDV